MNRYEQREHNAILAWKNEAPSVVSKVSGFVFKPASWLIEKIIPQKAIEGCLVAFDKAADFLTDTADVVRDGAVSKVKDLQTKSLKLSDELANEVHNWALATAAVEGAATGSAGVVGLAVDVPAMLTISLRAIHKIGVCYGFEVKTEKDHSFVLGVLSAASANTMAEKTASLSLLQKINVTVAKATWKKIAEEAAKNKYGLEALIVAIRNLAKQLGINLTKRKVAQLIPVIGAGVGAAVNVAFINDVAWAARRMYQERWLLVNKKLNLSQIRK
jgi:hypothetical protein